MIRHTIFAAAALVAALTPAARATELYTAPSQAETGNIIRCAVTNVTANPITVMATVVGADGSDITNSSNCYGPPAVIAPGAICFAASEIPGTKSGYCHFTTSTSKVRAALEIVASGGLITSTLPATK